MSKPPFHFVTPEEMQVELSPWTRNEWLAKPGLVNARQLLLVRAIMAPGKAHLFHRHPGREEIIYVVQGQAEQWVGQEAKVLQVGDMAHIPTDTVHATFNPFAQDLVFLAILSPAESDLPDTVDVSGLAPWDAIRVKPSAG